MKVLGPKHKIREGKRGGTSRKGSLASVRVIFSIEKSRRTIEGAGVRLKRAFGLVHPSLDPFLLLDDFHSDNPEDYIAGFPWHPHRGIETITYLLHGKVEHGDSLGNRGVIQSGEVQWMTAGSGIIHQEMPLPGKHDTLLRGFQLWANLPASHKMMEPRYRDIPGDQIPEVRIGKNARIRVISGEVSGVGGPVQGVITDPTYLDITITSGLPLRLPVKHDHNVFAYVIEGEGYFEKYKEDLVAPDHLVVYREGDEILVTPEEERLRFLLIGGKPIREPVAWRGSIVMNTKEELGRAFEEYEQGTFIRPQRAGVS